MHNTIALFVGLLVGIFVINYLTFDNVVIIK